MCLRLSPLLAAPGASALPPMHEEPAGGGGGREEEVQVGLGREEAGALAALLAASRDPRLQRLTASLQASLR